VRRPGRLPAVDGVRAFVVGSDLTPASGQHASRLGPWARVVRFVGIAPESTGMKAAFVVVLGAGYLVPGTLISAAVIVLVLLAWTTRSPIVLTGGRQRLNLGG
jgi:hypothetical protein